MVDYENLLEQTKLHLKFRTTHPLVAELHEAVVEALDTVDTKEKQLEVAKRIIEGNQRRIASMEDEINRLGQMLSKSLKEAEELRNAARAAIETIPGPTESGERVDRALATMEKQRNDALLTARDSVRIAKRYKGTLIAIRAAIDRLITPA